MWGKDCGDPPVQVGHEAGPGAATRSHDEPVELAPVDEALWSALATVMASETWEAASWSCHRPWPRGPTFGPAAVDGRSALVGVHVPRGRGRGADAGGHRDVDGAGARRCMDGERFVRYHYHHGPRSDPESYRGPADEVGPGDG